MFVFRYIGPESDPKDASISRTLSEVLEMVGFAQNIEDAREAHRRSAIRLTPKEFELLTVLAAHVGRVITHRSILKAIWGVNGSGQQEHLRVLVGQLRRKLEPDPAHPRYILTEP